MQNIPKDLQRINDNPELLGLYIANMFIDRNLDVCENEKRERNVLVFNGEGHEGGDNLPNETYLSICANIFLESLKIKDIDFDSVQKLNRYGLCGDEGMSYIARLKGPINKKDCDDQAKILEKQYFGQQVKCLEDAIESYEGCLCGQRINQIQIYCKKPAEKLPDKLIANYNTEIKDAGTNAEKKLDAILTLVSSFHNNHIFSNGNTRTSIVLLNMLLEKNGLAKCMMPHNNDFCVHYAIARAMPQESPDYQNRLADYYNGVEHHNKVTDILNNGVEHYIEKSKNQDISTNQQKNNQSALTEQQLKLKTFTLNPNRESKSLNNLNTILSGKSSKSGNIVASLSENDLTKIPSGNSSQSDVSKTPKLNCRDALKELQLQGFTKP